MSSNGGSVTMQDVASLAKVSVKTVSNVLADYEHVSEKMRERVLAAVAELNYEINVSARNLRTGRTQVIGLAVPELSQAYFAELADAVIRAAQERNYTVLIEQTTTGGPDEIATVAAMRRHAIDGVIFSPFALEAGDLGSLDVDFPVVVLADRDAGSPADHVTMSNREAIKATTNHLIDSGRSRIAVIGANPHDPIGTAAMRFRGYADALGEHGRQVDDALVCSVPLWHRADGAAAIEALIEQGTPFDAVVCFNDALALGAMASLQRLGRRVPEDVAVVGFDDIEDSRFSTPTLTTISPGREATARTAVDSLVRRIEQPELRGEPVDTAIDFQLVVRNSSRSTSPLP
ncbi:LacI family transcriptional regulator [Plantibacter flavus]|uniref:LacI family DNA-binding transcriptional regulator n=1 Tax=Plantibacter flavus TaxID=150123 RepID=UPI003F15C5E6